ncbi:MAG: hypothetical protein ABR964_04510 [Tepidisphaeraceae bacterium]|jgi:hypothetical protein
MTAAAAGARRCALQAAADYNRAMPADWDAAGAAPAPQDPSRLTHRLARLVLAAFVFTFVIARILVIYIMAGKLPPQLFFHVSGTHVHHLNYGIILLSATGAYLIFARPMGRRLTAAAILYGIGLGLTFDEFGMWLHLGGPYWQRASYDAVVTIASVLTLIAYGSTIRHWRPKHHVTVVALIVVLCVFGWALKKSMKWANQRVEPMLSHLENQGPT